MNLRGNRCRWNGVRIARAWLPRVAAIFFAAAAVLHAQGPGADAPAVRLTRPSIRPILVDVQFTGNNTIDDEQLLGTIQTHPTRTPLIKRYFLLLADFLELNPFAPRPDVKSGRTVIKGKKYQALRNMIDSLGGESRYLNLATLDADTNRIKALYDQYGYHDVSVDYRIELDTIRNTSIVQFIIQENERYPLKALTFLGLENIPADLRDQVTKLEIVHPGKPYSADLVQAETDRVVGELRNNGYAFAAATGNSPLVLVARATDSFPGAPFDSVLVFIYPGTRYRLGETTYEPDSVSIAKLGGSCTVDPSLVLSQREYEVGDIYSKDKLDQTVADLYALQTFDLVTIDTNRTLSADSVLGLRISARLRAQNDLRVAPEVSWERRITGRVTNVGLSSSYTRLNAFCTEGHLTLNGRFQVPVENLITRYPLNQAQGGLSVSYFLPSMPEINQRLSLLTTVSYDNSVIDQLSTPNQPDVTLRAQTWGAVGEVSFRLPHYTFLNLLSGRLTLQNNTYYGIGQYITRLADIRVDTATGLAMGCNLDSVRSAVRGALIDNIYRVQVLQGDDPNLVPASDTAARRSFSRLKGTAVATLSLVGDHRDDFFSPTTGALGEVRAELGMTWAFTGFFAKLEGNLRTFTPVGSWTWASRIHVGYIQEFGSLPLTPVSSRFSAGGASSLRGWEARDMLATRAPELDSSAVQDCAQPIVNEIVDENRRLLGGLALLELSTEFRTHIFNLTGTSTLSRQLNQLVFVGFVDAGNAYFRDREDIQRATWKFFYSNIGLDVGGSVGYDTPVGPFRVGVGIPVYDPVDPSLDASHKWIWNRRFTPSLVWHVGIGHAF